MNKQSDMNKSDNIEVVQNYNPPQYKENAFHCPHCNVYAHQNWHFSTYQISHQNFNYIQKCDVAFCVRCEQYSLWVKEKMIYPQFSTAPLPITEMPESVKELYNEARAICNQSPRGACALLRRAIQELMKTLGENENNLKQAISKLVQKKGLSSEIQRALHIVRVIGNNAVHPGQINIEDNPDIAHSLFKLVNMICEKIIKEPNEVEKLFEGLPSGQKGATNERDQSTDVQS